VGVVKTAGAEDILDVSHYKFGDNYIQVMGEGIAYL
jgi:phage-related protein